MSGPGQIRPFISVEPHALALTSRTFAMASKAPCGRLLRQRACQLD
jgi:hypothetical protein